MNRMQADELKVRTHERLELQNRVARASDAGAA
jgi:hypothetical protein